MPPKHDQLHYALTNDDRHMGAAAFEDRLRIGNKVANLLGVDRYSDPERVWAQFLEFESQQARARGISEHDVGVIVERYQVQNNLDLLDLTCIAHEWLDECSWHFRHDVGAGVQQSANTPAATTSTSAPPHKPASKESHLAGSHATASLECCQ